MEVLAELEFNDPSGQIQTVSSRIPALAGESIGRHQARLLGIIEGKLEVSRGDG